ncbi:PEP-CTERM sorting domain-containing protein [Roseibacillus ishigakijimensis]|uniref:PEP-CTERM sorting domain-containing protein n=1 Tax=Roseibacillus ishigakijimensis TaxID=454146 RepID=A0A934RRB2_9BACT|nr:PEP-CTERM sorting domain-containing protein [Roseibacillus ishigakijimensis]MBK1832830.1 PEP-CTERM sorting domain-containing protein [Roseibacillus ishigakijimensis]
MKTTQILSIAAASLAAPLSSQAATSVIYSADFESLPDQAPLVTAEGNPWTSFNANSSIGDTNANGDAASGGIYASPGANLATRNGMRGYGTIADANFTSAAGKVGQLHTFNGGGFGVLSVGPITTVGGENNQPTPITITPVVGDIYRVTFDMYVQAIRSETSALAVNWNLKDASFAAYPTYNTTWDDYTNAGVGDVLSITQDLVITQAMVDDGITSFGPQFALFNANTTEQNLPHNTAFAQVDNFQISHITIPEPSSMALLGLAGGLLAFRRKK